MLLRNVLIALLLGLLAVGCGEGSSDGTNVNPAPAATGTLSFGFARTQSVPATTTQLLFSFYDADGTLIFQTPRAFAPQATIENVPPTAVRVEMVSNDNLGRPLSLLSSPVTVQPGATVEVDLTAASATPITFDSLTVSPNPVVLHNLESQQLALQVQFSNGADITSSPTDATFSGLDEGVARSTSGGLVRGVAAGKSTLTVSYTVGATTRTQVVAVQVSSLLLVPVDAVSGATLDRPFKVTFTGADSAPETVVDDLSFAIEPAVPGFSIDSASGSITVGDGVVPGTSATVQATWVKGEETFTGSTTVTAKAAP